MAKTEKYWYGEVVKDDYNPNGKPVIKQYEYGKQPQGAVKFDNKQAAQTWQDAKLKEINDKALKANDGSTESQYQKATKSTATTGQTQEERKADIEEEDKLIQSNQQDKDNAGKGVSSSVSPQDVKDFNQGVVNQEANYRDQRAGAGTLGTGGTVEEQEETAKEVNERTGATVSKPESTVEDVYKAAVGTELKPNKPTSETTSETTSNSTTETEEVVEQAQEEVAQGKKPSDKFWDAWKSGKFDMYPTMKAIADSIAKNARMNMDRAALLTGGQRDYDAYDAIETEQDKIRAKQIDERAENATGETNQEVIKSAMDAQEGSEQEIEAFKSLGAMIANGTVSYENVVAGMSASKKEAFDKAIGRFEETEYAKVKSTLIQNKATIQENIRAIDDQIMTLREVKRGLAGNDVDAYAKAVNAYLGGVKGISTVGSAKTEQSTSGGNAGLSTPVIGLGGSFSAGDASSTTFSQDTLAAARLPTAEQWGRMSMEEQNQANNEMIAKIDEQIAELEDMKAEWRMEFKTKTGSRL